jgi:hypothetical protein
MTSLVQLLLGLAMRVTVRIRLFDFTEACLPNYRILIVRCHG